MSTSPPLSSIPDAAHPHATPHTAPHEAHTDTMPPMGARHRVRRGTDRCHYDTGTLYRILDAAYVCHVAWSDGDHTVCLPTACWRMGHRLYIHGSNGSRMMRRLAEGAQACVTITLLDGLVLAKSAFAHSMNYRSAVIHGCFEAVPEADKPGALAALVDWVCPGRAQDARPADASELAATTVLSISLDEAAAKIRNWGPKDKEPDLGLAVWSGVLPMQLTPQAPQMAEGDAHAALPAPSYVQCWMTQTVIRN